MPPNDNDKTQLVPPPPRGFGDPEKTVVLTPSGQPLAGPQGGRVIGQAHDPQAHVRLANQPRQGGLPVGPSGGHMQPPHGHQHAGHGASGETVFLVPQAGAAPNEAPFDPVVGWVTIIKGRGRGQSRPVYYGQNSIGRDPKHRIPLDFGDQRMSRDIHAYIVYDEVDRKYYLRDNGQRNPIRHKGNIVLAATELKDRDEFTIGDTTLIFIALCNGSFDWLAVQSTGENSSEQS